MRVGVGTVATYVLALLPLERQPRCLISISPMGISFSISGYREFESLEAVEAFRLAWRRHFYKLDTLAVIEKPEKYS